MIVVWLLLAFLAGAITILAVGVCVNSSQTSRREERLLRFDTPAARDTLRDARRP